MADHTFPGAEWYIGPRIFDELAFEGGFNLVVKSLHGNSCSTPHGGVRVTIPHEHAALNELAWHFGALMHGPTANTLRC